MQLEYYPLIPHDRLEAVLLLETEQGWMLPRFTFVEPGFWQEVTRLNQAVNRRFGLEVTTLHCFPATYDPVGRCVRFVYAMENHSRSAPVVEQGRWIEPSALPELSFALPEQKRLVREWFEERHLLKVPWYRPGWTQEALAWFRAQLAEHGHPLLTDPEQVRSWERSSLWRAHTNQGDVYLKAVPPMFAHEAALTRALAAWFPGRFPVVLAAEPQRHWFVMKEAGQQALSRVLDVTRWQEALSAYARLQVALVSRTKPLLALGVPERRTEGLGQRVRRLLADTESLQQGPTGLSDHEIAQLRHREPDLLAACQALAASEVPDSLEHGDFSAGQILLNGSDFAFIDWSDSAISHPFFSMLFFQWEVNQDLPAIPDLLPRLRDAYLEPWRAYGGREHLLWAFDLAIQLAPLHHALIYSETVLPQMAMKWEMERMLPYYLRRLLHPAHACADDMGDQRSD